MSAAFCAFRYFILHVDDTTEQNARGKHRLLAAEDRESNVCVNARTEGFPAAVNMETGRIQLSMGMVELGGKYVVCMFKPNEPPQLVPDSEVYMQGPSSSQELSVTLTDNSNEYTVDVVIKGYGLRQGQRCAAQEAGRKCVPSTSMKKGASQPVQITQHSWITNKATSVGA